MGAIAAHGRVFQFGQLRTTQVVRLERAARTSADLYITDGPRLLPVPDLMQRKEFTCGPSALRAVLALYGRHVSEAHLARAARTSAATGTEPEDLARAAGLFGLQARVRSGMTLLDLKHSVLLGVAVIVNYQAWREPEACTPWQRSWGSGHYAVVVGVDRSYVYLQDPWILGRPDRIRRDEFLTRWHGGEDREGRRFMTGGVVVQPPYS